MALFRRRKKDFEKEEIRTSRFRQQKRIISEREYVKPSVLRRETKRRLKERLARMPETKAERIGRKARKRITGYLKQGRGKPGVGVLKAMKVGRPAGVYKRGIPATSYYKLRRRAKRLMKEQQARQEMAMASRSIPPQRLMPQRQFPIQRMPPQMQMPPRMPLPQRIIPRPMPIRQLPPPQPEVRYVIETDMFTGRKIIKPIFQKKEKWLE